MTSAARHLHLAVRDDRPRPRRQVVQLSNPRPLSAHRASRWLERMMIAFVSFVVGVVTLAALIVGVR